LIEAACGEGSTEDFLPEFVESKVDSERVVAGHRPYGVVGEHLRRSNVARYRDDVAVCRTLEQVLAVRLLSDFSLTFGLICDQWRQAVSTYGPKVVIKEEFSSSGLGVRVCEVRPRPSPTWRNLIQRSICDSYRVAIQGAEELQAGEPLGKWLGKCLRRDGIVTVEPWMEIIVEVICMHIIYL
jgi:hypothetical protein